jgi:hypothetical protein
MMRTLRTRGRVPMRLMPDRMQPVPLAEIRERSLRRPDALAVVEAVAPSARRYLDSFSEFWDAEVVPVAINAHADFWGQYAGSGSVDFLEAFALYALVRELRPARMLELGFAAGISSWVLATGLLHNEAGELDTVDIKDGGSIIPQFHRLAGEGLIHPHFGDAREFIATVDQTYRLTFSDALHTYDFNVALARALHARFPRATHTYHEWSLAPKASTADARYVSLRSNLGTCGERPAFEQEFGAGYRHLGIPSSSGLGVVIPAQ